MPSILENSVVPECSAKNLIFPGSHQECCRRQRAEKIVGRASELYSLNHCQKGPLTVLLDFIENSHSCSSSLLAEWIKWSSIAYLQCTKDNVESQIWMLPSPFLAWALSTQHRLMSLYRMQTLLEDCHKIWLPPHFRSKVAISIWNSQTFRTIILWIDKIDLIKVWNQHTLQCHLWF